MKTDAPFIPERQSCREKTLQKICTDDTDTVFNQMIKDLFSNTPL